MKNYQWLALALAFAMGAAVGGPLVTASTEEAKPEAPAKSAEAVEAVETAVYDAKADEEESKKSESGTVSLDEMGDRMLENYYPVMMLEESIRSIDSLDYDVMYERLRLGLNEISSGERMMLQYGLMDSYTLSAMQQGYSSLRDTFERVKKGDMQKDNADIVRQMRSAQGQILMAGESLYITAKTIDAGRATAKRSIEKLSRKEKELQLRYELGQVSKLTLDQVKAGKSQAESALKTLDMNRDAALLQLKAMTGMELGGTLTLSALPSVSREELDAMDLEKDLAAAMEASYDLYSAKKARDDARKAFTKVAVQYAENSAKDYVYTQAEHTWQSAQYEYENSLQSYELTFRTLYAQVKDNAQVLAAARSAYADKQKDYAATKLKYELGNLSKNAYADAGDDLADARDKIGTAERDLLSSYRSYRWAVDNGILSQ